MLTPKPSDNEASGRSSLKMKTGMGDSSPIPALISFIS
jgi:hypothetical protein